MSFSFYVRSTEPPRFSAVVDALAEPDCVCIEDAPADDAWQPGAIFHFYTRGRSARAIEVGLEGEVFRVRIMTCSARGDLQLALRLVDTLARLTGSLIEPEHPKDAAFPLVERPQRYGDEWIAHELASGPALVATLVDRDGQTLTMSGPRRGFHIGPRFLKELQGRGSDMPLGARILEAMVRLQSVDEEAYYPAAILQVSRKGGGDSISLAVWTAGTAYLFPPVQYLVFTRDDDSRFLVPHSAGPQIAGDDWTWMDERHALVEATPASDWPALIERATEHAVENPW
jgi:hypothetical protein